MSIRQLLIARASARIDSLLFAAVDADADVDETSTASDVPQKIVTVRIVAREKKSFPGDELILCMRGIGLRHGKFGIFHRYDGSDESKSIFSAASLVEPGSFDLQNINFAFDNTEHLFEATLHVLNFQDTLLLGELECHVGGNCVGKPTRLFDARQ